MKKILHLFLIFLLLGFGVRAQTFTQIHNYQAPDGLAVIKYFGIPFGHPPALNVTRQTPGALFWDTTVNILYAWNGVEWIPQHSTTSVDTTLYNYVYTLLQISDTIGEDGGPRWMPWGIVEDTTYDVNDSVTATLYTNGNIVYHTNRLLLTQQNIDNITAIINHIDSLKGRDTTFHLGALSNGSPFVTIAFDPLSRNDTAIYHFPHNNEALDSLAQYDADGNLKQIAISDLGISGGPETDPKRLVTLEVTGTTTKTITATLADASTVTGTFTDNDSGGTTADSVLVYSASNAFTFTSVPSTYSDYIIFRNGEPLETPHDYTTSGNIVTILLPLDSGDRIRYHRTK